MFLNIERALNLLGPSGYWFDRFKQLRWTNEKNERKKSDSNEQELGAIANPIFKLKGLKHQQKDMRLALALGDENAVSMPIAEASNEAFKKARSLGLGDLDFSAVHEIVNAAKDSESA
ncbi:hypothetical protein Cni_G14039 [Canna indica]|uniref:3-hydroxyisobutyrate dehydrogenase-like NAD-binding domain-containing protein n=1 Tax=Canna indica TaxID=4628 RepID=A0AAQ3QDA0_9LILI|nr:hypothetical protein Cni_G14039 [Canna indica]